MHSDFIKSRALIFEGKKQSEETINSLSNIFKIFTEFFLNSSEQIKRESLKICLYYLMKIQQSMMEQLTNMEKNEQLEDMSFMADLTESALPLCKDYWDSVRESACELIVFISKNFLKIPAQ